MANGHKPIRVTQTTDLPALLDEAANAPVFLERDGKLFRLTRADAESMSGDAPDADMVRRTLTATAGSWADLDIDTVINDLSAARRAGSRPPERP